VTVCGVLLGGEGRFMKDDKKRQYDSGKTRRSLTSAAIDLFSRIGYDAATTKGIAKKAGVNESLIQRYFANKMGLFSTVVHECEKKFFEDLPYEPAATLQEELFLFFKFRFDLVRREKKVYKLIMSRALLDKGVAGNMQKITQNGIPSLVDRLAALQKKGFIRQDISVADASVMVGCVSFSLSTWSHVLGKIDEKKALEIAELASHVLEKGMS
jgi:TetR/AcrR family transcriptional regulator, regulator of cefoperazone and chloramphenicol sensitivity